MKDLINLLKVKNLNQLGFIGTAAGQTHYLLIKIHFQHTTCFKLVINQLLVVPFSLKTISRLKRERGHTIKSKFAKIVQIFVTCVALVAF